MLGVLARLCRALGKPGLAHHPDEPLHRGSKNILGCSWSCTKTDLFCCSSEQQESRGKLVGVFGLLG